MARGFVRFHRVVVLGEEWVEPVKKTYTSDFKVSFADLDEAQWLLNEIVAYWENDEHHFDVSGTSIDTAFIWGGTYPSTSFWSQCADTEEIVLTQDLYDWAVWAQGQLALALASEEEEEFD